MSTKKSIFTKKIITNTVVNYVCILCDLIIVGLLIYDIVIKPLLK